MRLIDADALYNGSMKKEYFSFVEHDNHGKESFAYSCAMQRLVEAPTIDAIPLDWLREKMRGYASALKSTELSAVVTVMSMWEKEQEAQDE
jgi:hypothetical protein